jgi:hypothetical protein
MTRLYLLVGLLVLVLVLTPFRGQLRALVRGEKVYSVTERLRQYGPATRARLAPDFAKARVTYPPKRLVLAAFKRESELRVYAAGADGRLRPIRTYPILAASGVLGPKLREGDYQVPEGLYRIASLNPNSAFHLSLRVNYPNAFDMRMARRDGRNTLGGDIMIHGGAVSVGCLAMGDPAAEELFVMAADTGLSRIEVILAPLDLRAHDLPLDTAAALPPWTRDLYAAIKVKLGELPTP